MKKVSLYFLSLVAVGAMIFTFSSCGEETKPAPTLSIFASVDGYKVAFTAQATDADSYLWEFGDGKTDGSPNTVHIYEQSGSYTAKCTVTGGGGSVTKSVSVEIAASKMEMLNGGPAMTNGKKWVISPTGADGDGVYVADQDMTPETVPLPAGILGLIGFASEYDDEFGFVHDLSYVHNVMNDSSVTGTVFAMLNGLDFRLATGEEGVVLAPFVPDADATYTFTEDTDLTLEVVDPNDDDNTVTVTYTGVDVLEITDPEFVVIRDYTKKYIIFDISVGQMTVGAFISATDKSKAEFPSHILRMTMISATPK